MKMDSNECRHRLILEICWIIIILRISEYHHHESVVNNVNEPINNNYNYILWMCMNKWWPRRTVDAHKWMCPNKNKAEKTTTARNLFVFSNIYYTLFHFVTIDTAQLLLYRCVYSTHGHFLLTHAEWIVLWSQIKSLCNNE